MAKDKARKSRKPARESTLWGIKENANEREQRIKVLLYFNALFAFSLLPGRYRCPLVISINSAHKKTGPKPCFLSS
jgi:hypothetical protein